MNLKEKISYVLIAFSILLALVMIIWYALGHSPTDIQVLIALILSPYIFAFGIYERISNKFDAKIEKLDEKISQTNSKLSQAREDFQHQLGEIRQSLGRIEGRLNTKT